MDHTPTITTLAMWVPGTWELLIILAIGLLLFGRRLPEVGRSLGKSIVEFKKGIKGIEDEIDSASDNPDQIEGKKKDADLPADSRTVSRADDLDTEPPNTSHQPT